MKIAIAGPPKSAKSTIGDRFAQSYDLDHIKTDYFKAWGYELSKDKIIDYLDNYQDKGFVISGMQVPRVLRQLAKDDKSHVDILIRVNCNKETIKYFYEQDGEGEKVKSIESQIKSVDTVIEEYLKLASPEVINVDTSIL